MSGKRDSGAMKAAQAVRILALAAEDDFEAAKKKYRNLMGQFHPDSAGAGEPEYGNDRRAGIRAKRIEHFWNVEQWEKTQQTCNREHILAPI